MDIWRELIEEYGDVGVELSLADFIKQLYQFEKRNKAKAYIETLKSFKHVVPEKDKILLIYDTEYNCIRAYMLFNHYEDTTFDELTRFINVLMTALQLDPDEVNIYYCSWREQALILSIIIPIGKYCTHIWYYVMKRYFPEFPSPEEIEARCYEF